jgi:hypothetical protein
MGFEWNEFEMSSFIINMANKIVERKVKTFLKKQFQYS